MTDAAIIQAEYVEWKMVKTRKALQLIFEVPLEHQAMVQAALGTPMPDTSSPVAIARLNLSAALTEPAQIAHDNDDARDEPGKPPRPLSQVSAILCNIVAFRRFIMEQYEGWKTLPTVDEAADWVREQCGVQSRRQFDTDDVAAANFKNIRSKYWAWMEAA
jgi:hypothetical protein